jgi:(E)-4-hydroxy-3-methylbut-2-enyl-diphosphate synthase
MLDAYSTNTQISEEQLLKIASDDTVVFCLSSQLQHAMAAVRRMFIKFMELGIDNPVILITDSKGKTTDEHLIHFATETGATLGSSFPTNMSYIGDGFGNSGVF